MVFAAAATDQTDASRLAAAAVRKGSMERNIILAGVGGQGILTIAHVISTAAVRRGWHVKQAEIHGMSQRGGAVYSHLRLADHPIYSDLIPNGQCDLIVGMEPLEALRYVQCLRPEGAILSNVTPFVNLPKYPPLDELLAKIAAFSDHVLLDCDRLCRAAGAALGANSTLLGATATYLDFTSAELEDVLCGHLASKGARIVEANRKAFRLGYAAASGYRDGLARGATQRELRGWVQQASADDLLARWASNEGSTLRSDAAQTDVLSPEAVDRIADLLRIVAREDRTQLREHEVYRIVELVGAITPPHHVFLGAGTGLDPCVLEKFHGDKVVLKLVSADVVHKSDAGGVVFVTKAIEQVRQEVHRLIERHTAAGANVDGVLLVDFIEHDDAGFGKELFVGIRASREFGPVIVAGVGGVDTEYLAERMRPGSAAASALALDTSAGEFLERFQRTAAYDVLAGHARGHRRVVSDGELLRCFRAFLALAQRFCTAADDSAPCLAELEVNPFAFVRQRMVPLDGRGRLGAMPAPAAPRPPGHLRAMLEPESIGIVGVSAQRVNFARIILDNIIESGFPVEDLRVIHPEADSIDGVRCIRRLRFTDEPLDMVVAAVAAEYAPAVVQEAIDCGKVKSIILIPGGLGETEGSEELGRTIQESIRMARGRTDGGPVILGGNCLGVRSRPGRYDTFFVPSEKLDPRRTQPASRTALVTQSGAFAIIRLSNLESINAAIAVTLGNQSDITVSDMVRAVGEREDISVIGVYVEGFNTLDGLEFVRVVGELSEAGKVVVFYKAGRTAQGRTATAGHTASIAGDYDVCQAAASAAGAIVVDTFKEFEQIVELATLFHQKTVTGKRIGAITNAGAEAVAMADTIQGPRYRVELATLSDSSRERIRQTLAANKLDRLVNVCNPLDLNPMANEQVYEEAIRAMLADPGVDAVVVSLVPFTPHLLTTPGEIEDRRSLAHRIPDLFRDSSKPLLVVVDAGPPYDVLARTLRRGGVPVFPSCDQAIRSLGRYIDHLSNLRRSTPIRIPQSSVH